MSEETFGREREMQDAGYTPLTVETTTGGSDDEIDLEAAAQRRREQIEREQPTTVLETKFHDVDPEKPAAFDKETAAEVLKASRARYHAENIAPEQEAEDGELRRQVDAIRSGEPSQPQLEQDPAPKADAVREHQELMEQLVAQQQQQETAAKAKSLNTQHEHIEARGMAAVAQLSAEFPEIANLPLDKVQGAIAALEARGDHARARALVGRLQTVDALYQQREQVKAAQAQHESTQHLSYIQAEGKAFDKATANDPPARRQAVAAGVVDLLRSVGLDSGAYADAARKGGELGRFLASNVAQSILYKAAAAMIDAKSNETHKAELQKKLARADVPPVQRPGSGGQRAFAGAALDRSKLNAKLASGGENALRAAAAQLIARRAR